MVIGHFDNSKNYIAYLRENPNELQALFEDLLVGVTSFFREPKTFDFLKEKVFPELVKNRSAEQPIRMWIPGSSSGEETLGRTILL